MNLERIIAEYQSLRLDDLLDHKKFSEYALTHHSTTIEGATLTEVETSLLLDEDITPKGKPLEHSLMVKDHDEALKFVLFSASTRQPVTIPFIQAINAKVLKSTGKTYNTPLGTVDAAKGELEKAILLQGDISPITIRWKSLLRNLCNTFSQKWQMIYQLLKRLNYPTQFTLTWSVYTPFMMAMGVPAGC